MIPEIADLPEVSFIDNMLLTDVQEKIVNDYKGKYKEINDGKEPQMARGDPITLILYALSVQVYQALLYVDRSGKLNLLKYSYGNYLDNIAVFRETTREPEKPARTTVKFTLSDIRPDVVGIPQGTRVTNGELFFATKEYAEIPPGETSIEIPCVCMENGSKGNELAVGDLKVLVDPIPYMRSVENIDIPMGGADIESDESFKERAYIAPSRYSVAGPDDAYRYWVKTFNTNIRDVYVDSSAPTEVIVEFIMQNGELPTETMVRAVADFLCNEKIRPLTDKVTVRIPDTVPYQINMKYYINASDISKAKTIQATVEKAVDAYILWQRGRIGRDINPSRLIQMAVSAGAKRVELNEPAFVAVGKANVAALKSRTVLYGGIEDD